MRDASMPGHTGRWMSPFHGWTKLQENIMKTNLLALTLLAAIAAPAAAQDATVNLAPVPIAAPDAPTVRQLADETGLSPQRVRMVIGPRSGYAEYRITLDRTQRQFRNALGEERYNDLMAGRKIDLYNQKATARVAKVDAKSDSKQVMAP
jgi:hypothetical protein